jgi:electron transport complex protein RnfB
LRREFLRGAARGLFLTILGGVVGPLLARLFGEPPPRKTVWQIDPEKCIQCGRCSTECVLDVSAVKCVHDFSMCGYCERCFAFFKQQPPEFDSGAENQQCPTGAIRRRFVEDPYFEYVIDEELCIGCGRCVKGCASFGNGSLYLQVRHDRCLNCNECRIAAACPADAYMRCPVSSENIAKSTWVKSRV